MPLDTLHANHIGGAGDSRFELQRVNNALLYIAGLDSGSAEGGQPGSEDVLVLSLSSFPLPKRSIGIIETGWLNEKRKFAGNPTYDDLSVVYRDYVEAGVAKVLWKWNYQVHDPETGKTGLAKNYKKAGWMSLFAPDGSIERQYNIFGAWPSTFDPGDADMMGEDGMNITMTITIDKAIPSRGINPNPSQSTIS